MRSKMVRINLYFQTSVAIYVSYRYKCSKNLFLDTRGQSKKEEFYIHTVYDRSLAEDLIKGLTKLWIDSFINAECPILISFFLLLGFFFKYAPHQV